MNWHLYKSIAILPSIDCVAELIQSYTNDLTKLQLQFDNEADYFDICNIVWQSCKMIDTLHIENNLSYVPHILSLPLT